MVWIGVTRAQLYDLRTGSEPEPEMPVRVEGGLGPRIRGVVESIEGAKFTGKGDKPKVRTALLPSPPALALRAQTCQGRCGGAVHMLAASACGAGVLAKCQGDTLDATAPRAMLGRLL